MRKDFKEILSRHRKELEEELGVDNMLISFVDENADAHGTVYGNPISALYCTSSMLYKLNEKLHGEIPELISEDEVKSTENLKDFYGTIYLEAMGLIKNEL